MNVGEVEVMLFHARAAEATIVISKVVAGDAWLLEAQAVMRPCGYWRRNRCMIAVRRTDVG